MSGDERTVQVPVSLIERAAFAAELVGALGPAEDLRALLARINNVTPPSN